MLQKNPDWFTFLVRGCVYVCDPLTLCDVAKTVTDHNDFTSDLSVSMLTLISQENTLTRTLVDAQRPVLELCVGVRDVLLFGLVVDLQLRAGLAALAVIVKSIAHLQPQFNSHSFCCHTVLLGFDTLCLCGSVAEWLACWTQAQNGPGSNRSRDAVE